MNLKYINGRIHNATSHRGGHRGDPSHVYLLMVFCTRLSSQGTNFWPKIRACNTNLSSLRSRYSWFYSCCACQTHISTPSVGTAGTARCKYSIQTFKETFKENFSHFCVSSTRPRSRVLFSPYPKAPVFSQAVMPP